MGSWIGLRAGVQTSGGDVGERWAVAAIYEWRLSKVLSFPTEGSWYMRRGPYIQYHQKQQETDTEIKNTLNAHK